MPTALPKRNSGACSAERSVSPRATGGGPDRPLDQGLECSGFLAAEFVQVLTISALSHAPRRAAHTRSRARSTRPALCCKNRARSASPRAALAARIGLPSARHSRLWSPCGPLLGSSHEEVVALATLASVLAKVDICVTRVRLDADKPHRLAARIADGRAGTRRRRRRIKLVRLWHDGRRWYPHPGERPASTRCLVGAAAR